MFISLKIMKIPRGANAEARQILGWLNHKPSPEECERYTESHTRTYSKRHFYILTINRRTFGETNYPFDDDCFESSNLPEIIKNSIKEGTFKELRKVSLREYVKEGGSNIPCCLRNCEYEGDFPRCMRGKQ